MKPIMHLVSPDCNDNTHFSRSIHILWDRNAFDIVVSFNFLYYLMSINVGYACQAIMWQRFHCISVY